TTRSTSGRTPTASSATWRWRRSSRWRSCWPSSPFRCKSREAADGSRSRRARRASRRPERSGPRPRGQHRPSAARQRAAAVRADGGRADCRRAPAAETDRVSGAMARAHAAAEAPDGPLRSDAVPRHRRRYRARRLRGGRPATAAVREVAEPTRRVAHARRIGMRRRRGRYEVTEYLLGSGALFERLAIVRRWLRRPSKKVVARWDQIDISQPDAPRLLCAPEELTHE